MYIPTDRDYIVIGDVHGCIDELKLLLTKSGFTIDSDGLIVENLFNYSIILLGDFIDKGSEDKLIETLQFIYKNYFTLNRESQRFYIVRGNHEDMVYRYISKEPELLSNPKRLEEKERYYNMASILERDEKLREMFLKLYRETKIWLKYDYSREFSITFTHAPCEERYLAKDDKVSAENMIKCLSRSENRGVKLDELLPYIIEEAKDNRHFHMFGHLSQPDIRLFKNRICIDTSAIYGNSLSCAIIKKDRMVFDSVKFQNRQKSAKQNYNILFDF